jgi:hypothetical protein
VPPAVARKPSTSPVDLAALREAYGAAYAVKTLASDQVGILQASARRAELLIENCRTRHEDDRRHA